MVYPFSYDIIYSRRKSIAIQITLEGCVKVRAPYGCPRSVIESFLSEKQQWITTHLEAAGKAASAPRREFSDAERRRYIELARDIFTRKAVWYARIMGVTYGRISIREQKTRWGSCSSKGNLNFNWRLIFAPPEVLDYVVVHELAHRKEMNHSKAFYAIVESVMPDYRKWKQWLKENGGIPPIGCDFWK